MKSKLTQAEELILSGQETAARDILNQLVEGASNDTTVYEDAVNILLLADLYEDALRIIDLYEKRFGQWHGDFAKHELQSNLAQIRALKTNSRQVFNRLKVMKRGGPSSYPTLFPVRRIEITSEHLTITRRSDVRTYSWSNGITVLTREDRKMGMFGPAGGRRRWCNICTPDGLYNVFDISWINPDFAFPKQLLAALSAHSVVREGKWPNFRARILGHR